MTARPCHFVADRGGLDRAARLLAGCPEIGIDAEMDGLHAFRAKVCVLQIATPDEDVLIDTVALKDLGPLEPAFTRPGVVRFAHGAAHDVKCLKADFGFGIEKLFDTYIAAQLLGLERLGYGDIVQQRFGVPLDKALQTADWGKRPLTREQIEYLRGDVRFLIPLGKQLLHELRARDLMEEAEYEFARVSALPPESDGGIADDAYLKPKESRDLSPEGLAVLRELFLARHAEARALDRPPFKVVRDDVMVEVARRRPATAAELARVPGLPRGPIQERLLEAVRRGIEAGSPPPLARPAGTRPDADEIRARRAREEALRGWRKTAASGRGVPPMAVLPAYTLDEIARHPPESLEELSARTGMIPKRLELYGQQILHALTDGTGHRP